MKTLNFIIYYILSKIIFWPKKLRKSIRRRRDISKFSLIAHIFRKRSFFVIGDSHSQIFSRGDFGKRKIIYGNFSDVLKIMHINLFTLPDFITYHMEAATAYNSCEPNSSTQTIKKIEFLIQNKLLPKKCKLICSFGEIDCRVHIQKNAEKQNISIDECIKNVVDRYGKLLILLRTYGFEVFAYGPISTQKDTCKLDPQFPRYGTEKDRNTITKTFNKHLKNFCNSNNINFRTLFDDICDINMCSVEHNSYGRIFASDGVHLDKSQYENVKKLFKEKNNEKNIRSIC